MPRSPLAWLFVLVLLAGLMVRALPLGAEPPAAAALRARVTPAVVARFSPQVVFHQEERFFPQSIEWLLQGARRYQVRADNTPVGERIPIRTPDDLAGLDPSWRLELDPARTAQWQGGEVKDIGGVRTLVAPCYYSVRIPPDGSYVELDYRFLFGFNGPQTLHVKGAADFEFACQSMGEHQGDLEGVNVILPPGLDRILWIRTEAHGDKDDHPPWDLELMDGTHPSIRAAVNSHATYNPRHRPRMGFIEMDSVSGFSGVAAGDNISDQGLRWEPWKLPAQSRPFRQFGKLDGRAVGDQPWTTYQGRLGSFCRNDLTEAQCFNGTGLPWAKQALANANMNIMRMARGRIPDAAFDGMPPAGLGQRGEGFCEITFPAEGDAVGPVVIFSRVEGGRSLVLAAEEGQNPVVTVEAWRQTELRHQWWLVPQDNQGGGDQALRTGRWSLVNVKTNQALLANTENGALSLVPRHTLPAEHTWDIIGNNLAESCAFRPVRNRGLHLNIRGAGPYASGRQVIVYRWMNNSLNETWWMRRPY